MSALGPRALLITGAVGVGKTTVASDVGRELAERGIPGAVIDLDELRRCWPAPADDRFQHRLELQNVRAVCAAYREAGARVLVAAGVIEERSARPRYEEAMGAPLTVVRLTAAREVVRERLRRRHEFDPQGLAWHLDRFDELTAILDTAQVADVEISVDETSHATARAVLDAVWI